MRVTFFIALLSILLASACVDRLSLEINTEVSLGISIDGFISDQSGPYEIRIYSIFDIESKESMKTPVSAKSLIISDNKGNVETLQEIDAGIYQTSPSGIKGESGGIYKMKIELFDGRIYESLPDTILTPGSLDSLYLKFNETYNVVGQKEYNFDILFDASYDELTNNHFLWRFQGTFQAETHPELYPHPPPFTGPGQCFWLREISRCNYLPPCSGYRNVGTDRLPEYKKKYDCTCCTCWYNLFNPYPILSDELTSGGKVTGVKAGTVPLNQWTLEHKIRLDLSQMSLTHNTFRYWKAIRDQEKATGNLFQPVSGRIPRNFIQLSGSSIPIEGLFFATSISRQVKYLDRFLLPPNLASSISTDEPIFADDCRLLFPNSTNSKPAFWKD
ncbi:MAG: DUF4249 family protein [Bacteroidetes bacterium]|nr:DUF4249 family protein [Bacteroidota bacterium]